ncbi:MAG: hypothetical protein R3320_00040 [Nitriliruptorales bacterium]|nr:hypothetical protein [Nitriliruptorales bacterium]
MTMRHLPLLSALLVLLVAIPGGVAVAAEDDAGATTSLEVRVAPPAKEGLEHRLAVTLRGPDGEPVTNQRVAAYAIFEFLGERQALLGSGTTDATGTALIPVAPRRADYRIVARFTGGDAYAASTTEQQIAFPDEAIEPYSHVHSQHALLEPVRGFMPPAISVTVALLWVGLLGLAVVTIRRIKRDDLMTHPNR